MFDTLKPGGHYFAVMGVHARSPLMSEWHAANAAELGLPKLYDLDEVAEVFEGAGFEASVARLQLRFVPVSAHRAGHNHQQNMIDWLDYYSHDKILFRFAHLPRS
jgi:hypothetical protein